MLIVLHIPVHAPQALGISTPFTCGGVQTQWVGVCFTGPVSLSQDVKTTPNEHQSPDAPNPWDREGLTPETHPSKGQFCSLSSSATACSTSQVPFCNVQEIRGGSHWVVRTRFLLCPRPHGLDQVRPPHPTEGLGFESCCGLRLAQGQ